MKLIDKFTQFIRKRNNIPDGQEIAPSQVITDLMEFLDEELSLGEMRNERRFRDVEAQLADLKRAATPVPYPHPATSAK